MKSIKEKAEEYGIANPNINYDSDGERYDDVKTPALDYMEGANYVLDEIEPLINLLRSGARALFEEKIKELKGE